MGKFLRLSIPALALVAVLLLATQAAAAEEAFVVRAVDGDTLEVRIAGRLEKVRLIGVDTPESVHPRKPVEFFGKEAAAFTRRTSEGKSVRLEEDPSNANRDRYGRLLRYVYLPDGKLLNAELIRQGYGHAYTRFPFQRMEEFRRLERDARESGRGLWGQAGNPPALASAATSLKGTGHPVGKPADTVYVTKTGKKYHAAGCRHLRRSSRPVKLQAAARILDPCSICRAPVLPEDPRAESPKEPAKASASGP